MPRILRLLVIGLFLLACSFVFGQTPNPIPVTGNLYQISGQPQGYTGVLIQLYNCPTPVTIPSYYAVVQTAYELQANSSGIVNGTVWGVDQLDCNGTTGNAQYQVTYLVNGTPSGTPQCYQPVTSMGTWNLATLQPITCTQSPPNPQDAQFRNLVITNSVTFPGGLSYMLTSGATMTGPLFTPQLNYEVNASSYASLNLAVAACPLGGGCSIDINNSVPMTAALTVPSSITLHFNQPGSVNQSAFALTINGPVEAQAYQIFTGTGTVTGLSTVRPEWFGAAAINSTVIGALSSNGGVIQLQNATYTSSYASACFTKDDVWFQGAKQPVVNSGYTGLINGTIIQKGLQSCGSNRVKATNLGIDNGSALGVSTNDALSISGLTGGGSDPIVANPYVENVTTLESSGTAAFHSMRIEHCDGAYIHNIHTYYGVHGLALKCTNSHVDTQYSYGNGNDGLDIKSDTYTSTSHVKADNIFASSLPSNPQNWGVVVDANAVSLSDVEVSHVSVLDAAAGFIISSEGSATALGVKLNDMFFENTSSSFGVAGAECFGTVGNEARYAEISNVLCVNGIGTGFSFQPMGLNGPANRSTIHDIHSTGATARSYVNGALVYMNNWVDDQNSTQGYGFQANISSTIGYLTNYTGYASNVSTTDGSGAALNVYSSNGNISIPGTMQSSFIQLGTGAAMLTNHGTGASLQHSDGTGNTGNLAKFSADGSVTDAGVNAGSVVTAGSPTVGQATCVKALGPPISFGFCSTVVSSSGACTCN